VMWSWLLGGGVGAAGVIVALVQTVRLERARSAERAAKVLADLQGQRAEDLKAEGEDLRRRLGRAEEYRRDQVRRLEGIIAAYRADVEATREALLADPDPARVRARLGALAALVSLVPPTGDEDAGRGAP